MSEYSQEEVEQLAAEVRAQLQERAGTLARVAERLGQMAEQYQPGRDYDDLHCLVRYYESDVWLLTLNRYDELTLDMAGVVKAIAACNDELSGLQDEQGHMEVAS